MAGEAKPRHSAWAMSARCGNGAGASAMQLWTQFYATIGTASAALLGLLFVAVSINAQAALGPQEAFSRRLTEQAFQNHLPVMMVSFLALFPGIETTTFGAVTLIMTAGWSAWVVIRFCQMLRHRLERRVWLYSMRRHISSLIGFGILLVSALRMALNGDTSYNWFAAATLVLLLSATTLSWQLLSGSRGGSRRSPIVSPRWTASQDGCKWRSWSTSRARQPPRGPLPRTMSACP